MNGLGKNLENRIQKIEKTVKTKVKLPHVNKKTTSERANFCLERKISRRKTTRFFAPFPVSARPKSLQFDYKNHENV